MDKCLFCNIVNNNIPCDKLIENDSIIAFRDINPQAPTHILIIPKKHISTINDLKPDDSILIGELFLIAKELAQVENINNSGFRTVFNCNEDGGQTVFHIHLHLLGGRKLSWPPG
jgi:histidine triad (HIT) family protein